MENYVQVPIPERFVLPVYELLTRLSSESEDTRPKSTPAAPNVNGVPHEWSKDDIARMWRESPPPMKAFISHLADRPETAVTSAEVGDAIGRRGSKFSGTLGAFGRRMRSRYKKDSWPFEAYWDHNLHCMVYRMSMGTAEIIAEMASKDK